MPNKRAASPIIQMVRDYLLGRKNTNTLRFRDEIAARTQAPPNLPGGPHAKVADNYYYTRDARRQVKPNEVVVEGSTMLKLPEGGPKPTTTLERVPGKVFHWDQ